MKYIRLGKYTDEETLKSIYLSLEYIHFLSLDEKLNYEIPSFLNIQLGKNDPILRIELRHNHIKCFDPDTREITYIDQIKEFNDFMEGDQKCLFVYCTDEKISYLPHFKVLKKEET